MEAEEGRFGKFLSCPS